jgi:hypothetical protein
VPHMRTTHSRLDTRASAFPVNTAYKREFAKVKTDEGTGGRGPVFTDGGSRMVTAHLTAEHCQQLIHRIKGLRFTRFTIRSV